MKGIYFAIPMAPLIGALITGLFGRFLGKKGTHFVALIGVGAAFCLSLIVFFKQVLGEAGVYNHPIYTWLQSGPFSLHIGFLVDHLTILMMLVVTFVSFMVHIYTIGYMWKDSELWPESSLVAETGYQRFFSYIELFTFAMLMLVMANNFMQLFFGWEGVGLVSYLLIGFYLNKESAIFANLKAFLVNRVGDLGFLLGIGVIYAYAGTLNYSRVFSTADQWGHETICIIPGMHWSVATVAAILLFIGAMGKSAQVPLHVWLPDSMEGPTPISALIHAATMVTAGVYMVSRMSPIYELSVPALSLLLIIGALNAFFMGLVGIVQYDIKRVIAYSTLSQLGYMVAALGASAYAAGIFHLMTHAFFKALLFLGAGSVILAMHHEQDMRKMGGLGKYMPITYGTMLIGSLALSGIPGFSGYYSKDSIIDAVSRSHIPGSGFSKWLLILGVIVTALYTFRMFFMTFHGRERMDEHTRKHLKESPWVVTIPLILLAIPSLLAGYLIYPVLYGGFFGHALVVLPSHDVFVGMRHEFHGVFSFTIQGIFSLPFLLAILGIFLSWYFVIYSPEAGERLRDVLRVPRAILLKGYGFDAINNIVFAGGAQVLGRALWKAGDQTLIDGLLVNGSAKVVNAWSKMLRYLQTGYLYHYSFAMIVGILGLLGWVIWK